jgi:hypothetical protein
MNAITQVDTTSATAVNSIGPQLAADFIKGMFGPVTGMPVHVCSLGNDKDGKHPFRRLDTRDPNELAAFVKRWDHQGRATYFCVGTLKDATKARNKENVAEISFLWADVDFKDIGDSRADVERKLSNLKYPPSVTVFTGHGIHCYWLLTESVDAQAEGIRDRMKRTFAYYAIL